MTYRSAKRQLSRLREHAREKEAELGNELQKAREVARDHAIQVCALILYGEPSIDSPLQFAWQRVWKKLSLSNVPPQQVAERLRKLILPSRRGKTECEKIANVMRSAPSWLRSFCGCMIDANLLGFRLPSGDELYEPAADDNFWPGLPMKTPVKASEQPGPLPDLPFLAPNPIAMGYDEGLISVDELMKYEKLLDKGEGRWTRRERDFRDELMTRLNEKLPKHLQEQLGPVWKRLGSISRRRCPAEEH